MDEILQEFLNEAFEQLDCYERDLEQLAVAPSDPTALEEAYRSLHTVKGASGFLGLSQVEALTTAGELLLGRALRGGVELTAERRAALQELEVRLRGLLQHIRESGDEGPTGGDELVERLTRLADR